MEGNNWSSGISIAGRTSDPARPDSSSWNRVGPRYFETVGTRGSARAGDRRSRRAGRPPRDCRQSGIRKQFFSDADPLGQHLGIGDASHTQDFEIVGVVDDVKYTAASQPVRPMFFLPAFQSGEYADASARNVQSRSMLARAVVIRTAPGVETSSRHFATRSPKWIPTSTSCA